MIGGDIIISKAQLITWHGQSILNQRFISAIFRVENKYRLLYENIISTSLSAMNVWKVLFIHFQCPILYIPNKKIRFWVINAQWDYLCSNVHTLTQGRKCICHEFQPAAALSQKRHHHHIFAYVEIGRKVNRKDLVCVCQFVGWWFAPIVWIPDDQITILFGLSV